MSGKIADDETSFERVLLDAARSEEPSLELDRRMLLPLGVLPMVAASAPVKGAARAAALKWAVLGAVVLGGTGLWVMTRAKTSDSSPSIHEVRPNMPRERVLSPEPAPENVTPDGESAKASSGSRESNAGARNSTPRRTSAGKSGDTLKEELALLEKARALLESGRRDGALEVLARYRRRYQNGQLREEARVLEQKAKR